MDSRTVEDPPLNARNTYQLLQLQPGVTGVGGADLFYGSDQAAGFGQWRPWTLEQL